MTSFFKFKPNVNAYDTEFYHGEIKLIADAYGNFIEPNNFLDVVEFLFKTKKDLNFFYNIQIDLDAILKRLLRDKEGNNRLQKDILRGDFYYKNYHFRYVTGKNFKIRKTNSNNKSTFIAFDIAPFYATGEGILSLDKISQSILGKGKNNEELGLKRENIGMIEGYYEDHRDQIIKYCINDSNLTRQLAERKIIDIYNMLGNYPKRWNSTASISKAYLTLNHEDEKGSYWRMLKGLDSNNIVRANKIIQNSYYGGIMRLYKLGYVQDVSEYDLNSSYPAMISELYSLNNCKVSFVNEYQDADYSFWKVEITNDNFDFPIPVRTEMNDIAYFRTFNSTITTYKTGLEVKFLVDYGYKIKIIEGIIIETDKKRVFRDYLELYRKRQEIKEKKDTGNDKEKMDTLQWSYKTILNATYGVFAESKNGFTQWTNFVYASYITASTKVKIWSTIAKIGKDNVIAIMTDAILVKSNVELEDSKEIGHFKNEFRNSDVLLLQNGLYVVNFRANKPKIKKRGFQNLKIDDLNNAHGSMVIKKSNKATHIKEGIIQHKISDIAVISIKEKKLNLKSNINNYELNPSQLDFDYLKTNSIDADPLMLINTHYIQKEKKVLYEDFSKQLKLCVNLRKNKVNTFNIEEIMTEKISEKIEKICLDKPNRARNIRLLANKNYVIHEDNTVIPLDQGYIDNFIGKYGMVVTAIVLIGILIPSYYEFIHTHDKSALTEF